MLLIFASILLLNITINWDKKSMERTHDERKTGARQVADIKPAGPPPEKYKSHAAGWNWISSAQKTTTTFKLIVHAALEVDFGCGLFYLFQPFSL